MWQFLPVNCPNCGLQQTGYDGRYPDGEERIRLNCQNCGDYLKDLIRDALSDLMRCGVDAAKNRLEGTCGRTFGIDFMVIYGEEERIPVCLNCDSQLLQAVRLTPTKPKIVRCKTCGEPAPDGCPTCSPPGHLTFQISTQMKEKDTHEENST